MLFGEYDSSGNFVREYIYLNGEPIAQIDAGTPEVLTYLHTDHLGAPVFCFLKLGAFFDAELLDKR